MGEPTPTRPLIPAAYGVPKDGSGGELLPWSWAIAQLEAARNYWICTARPDGRPHAMPVWGVWLGGAVWFSTGDATQKARNLERERRTVVHLESGDDVVILEGEAEAVVDEAEFERVAGAYEKKYGERPPAGSPLFAFQPRSAYTWRLADYPGSVAGWTFES